MNCKSPTVQGYASRTELAAHQCNLPHTGADLGALVLLSVLVLAVGVALFAWGWRREGSC